MVIERESPIHVWRDAAVGALVAAIAYFLVARVGLILAIPPAYKASAVWPASGVALAAVLFWGRGVLPGIWAGAFLGNVADFYIGPSAFSFGAHVMVAVAIATGSTIQAWAGAFLVTKWVGSNDVLHKGADVLRFFGAVCVACLIASTIGVAGLVLAGFAPASESGFNWLTWWLGDAVGMVLVAPFLLVWISTVHRSLRSWAEVFILMVVLSLVAYIAFADGFTNTALAASIAFLTVPLIVLSTFRFGKYGATLSLLLFSGIATWGTSQGNGPFIFASSAESLLSLQAFAGILALTALSLAGVMEERKTEAELRTAAIAEMENLLTEISTLRSMIPVCAWCRKVRNDAGAWEQMEDYVQRHFAASFTHGICPECNESVDGDDVLDQVDSN